MAKKGVGTFYKEVRQEVSKVTWPSRNETFVTTVMVFIFVIVMAIFFLIVDSVIGWGIRQILSIGQ